MKISYNWLKQFINLTWEAEKTAELLTDIGLEIEGIEAFSSIPGGLEGVVVGHVVSCEAHPQADRLKIAMVDVGNGAPLQIVCGAQNIAKGQKVPVAAIGTTLYDEKGKPWQIKKGKIRGEISEGMICAEDELGLGNNHDGILLLDTKLKPGTPVSKLYEIENDMVFEIGLTPNRADAMSHWGVARDIRAGLLQQKISLEMITPSTSSFHVNNRGLKIDVEVEDNELAPRYCGLTISGLKVGPSPLWMQNRLKSIGLAPINNVVDITNYVLHELGQPLHAFDTAAITGNKIIVKTLPEGTKFSTLDGIERKLHSEDLMICNNEKPMCIAGVFGGIASGVTEETTSIFLESAYFNPVSIRRTAKRHNLSTDASFRFERGIDPNACKYAMLRAAILITEIAGGKVTSDIVDIYPKRIEDHQVFLNFNNTTKLIGEEIAPETIKSILTSLDIKINNVTEGGIGITIPSYRNDVTREADVIEEILRIFGYNNIRFSEKLSASIYASSPVEDHLVQNKVSGQLVALGFSEILGNSLTSPKYTALTDAISEAQTIPIVNPLSQELSVLRQAILFGALEAVAYNNNRKMNNIRFFEFGKTYHASTNGHSEKKHLALTITGAKTEESWVHPAVKSDFFYLKGVVTALLDRLRITQYQEEETTSTLFSEGLSFSLEKKPLVNFGIVSKKIAKHFDIDTDVFHADFEWDRILECLPTTSFTLQPIPKFPAVKRDFALLIDEAVSFKGLKEAAMQTNGDLLKEVTLFDVYTGANLPKGKKSYALSFTLQDANRTLTDKQIDTVMKKLQQRFETDFGASLR